MSPIGPGGRIGRFEISRILGRGAMGTVYLARDPRIDRDVAIKTLRDPSETSELSAELEARFHNEAKMAGRLQHPNVVTIYEAGREGGVLYMVMECVDGEPLDRYVVTQSPGTGERLELVRQAALALGHAHEKGVLHRDVKPGNILVTRDGDVKVADFGIGKLLTGSGNLTRTGQLVGSPAYMSPEQIRGGALDTRSDLFSLGVVLYELLTGARPFPGNSMTTLVYQILHTEARDPLAARGDLPPVAREVFARLLAKDPGKRPADAVEFVRELARLGRAEARQQAAAEAASPPAMASVPPGAPPPPLTSAPGLANPASSASPAARARVPAGFWIAGIFAAAIVVIFLLRGRSRSAPAEASEVATPAPAATAASTAVPVEGPADAVVIAAPRPSAKPADGHARVVRTPPPPAPPAVSEKGGDVHPARALRTREGVKIGVSPDQARVYLDGRYVGIADDWDDRGGGRTLPLPHDGVHRIRISLPGYREMNVEVVRSRGAAEDVVEIGGDLSRFSEAPVPKVGRIDEKTTGPVEFKVEPSNAVVSENGRRLGLASSFGPASPLRLTGPRVHDLVISAPGRQRKTVRVLVSPNAGEARATVKTELKD